LLNLEDSIDQDKEHYHPSDESIMSGRGVVKTDQEEEFLC
jgi:hypothetical protein